MPDLILHIGLSKAGSTTIQSAFFKNVPGYIGRGGADPNGNALCTDLLRRSHLNKVNTYSINSLRLWKTQVEQYEFDNRDVQDRLILSSEVLSKNNGKDYFALFRLLGDLSRVWANGEIKVIVVLRRQAQKIASEYAQKSAKRFNASQQDFEKYLHRRVAEGALDYSALVHGLWDVVGKENVCVLFMEGMAKQEFWEELAVFCGIDDASLCDRAVRSQPTNRKARSARIWAVQDPCNDLSVREFANTVLTWTWPLRLFPNARRVVNTLMRKFYKGVCRARTLIEKRREDEIRLTGELQKVVRDTFEESNRRLERMLERDLKGMGY
ncbi:MAG: hypothetical protein R6U98_02785 [Pirellulaceae bacterium]